MTMVQPSMYLPRIGGQALDGHLIQVRKLVGKLRQQSLTEDADQTASRWIIRNDASQAASRWIIRSDADQSASRWIIRNDAKPGSFAMDY